MHGDRRRSPGVDASGSSRTGRSTTVTASHAATGLVRREAGALLAEHQHAVGAAGDPRLERHRGGHVVHADQGQRTVAVFTRGRPRDQVGDVGVVDDLAGTGRSPSRRGGSSAAGRRRARTAALKALAVRTTEPMLKSCAQVLDRHVEPVAAGVSRSATDRRPGSSTGTGRRRCGGRRRAAAPGRTGGRPAAAPDADLRRPRRPRPTPGRIDGPRRRRRSRRPSPRPRWSLTSTPPTVGSRPYASALVTSADARPRAVLARPAEPRHARHAGALVSRPRSSSRRPGCCSGSCSPATRSCSPRDS